MDYIDELINAETYITVELVSIRAEIKYAESAYDYDEQPWHLNDAEYDLRVHTTLLDVITKEIRNVNI